MTDTAETMVERVMATLFRELRPDDKVSRYAVGDIVGDEITYIDYGPVNVRNLARAAIAAMAEPTAEMLRAAQAAEHEHFWPGKPPTSHTWQSLPTMLVKKIWTAMALNALTEPNT